MGFSNIIFIEIYAYKASNINDPLATTKPICLKNMCLSRHSKSSFLDILNIQTCMLGVCFYN